MRILIFAAAPALFGMGHWTRAEELARAATARGWRAALIPYVSAQAARDFLGEERPDWIVFDIPEPCPDWAFEAAPVCVLNGVGREPAEDRARLIVIQGLASGPLPPNAVGGPPYVILRPQIFSARPARLPAWLVWDGHLGRLGLHEAFARAMQGIPAVHILGRSTAPGPDALCLRPNGDEVIPWLAAAKAACVAMGMIVWELVALRKPCHVFSATPLHYRFAREMEREGLIAAWPGVGLPSLGELAAFLAKPAPIPAPRGLDGQGAQRVLDELAARA